LIAFNETGVTFRYKDYRRDGADRQRTVTLTLMNSSASSCSTFCRKVSIVSVIMASSPAAVERPISRAPGCCSLCQSRLRSENPQRHRTYLHRASVAAVAWSSSKSSSMPLRRARHHPRHPLPGWRCRDASQRVSSCSRSGASASGWSRNGVRHRLLDWADGRQMGLPAVVALCQLRPLTPAAPPGATTQRYFAAAASPARAYRNLQIPIVSARRPGGSCLGGFRTPARAQTSDQRWPASENLHHVGPSGEASHFPKADINIGANLWHLAGLLKRHE
jgi:hypothetical protein